MVFLKIHGRLDFKNVLYGILEFKRRTPSGLSVIEVLAMVLLLIATGCCFGV